MDAPVPALENAHVVMLEGGQGNDPSALGVREIAQQLPMCSDLASGTLVAISDHVAEADKRRGLLRRVLGKAPSVRVPRAFRCTALIARGYVRLGGGVDDKGNDWAWGYVP